MTKRPNVHNLIFIAFFMACLIVPSLLMNRKAQQTSDIDNKVLTEWPGISFTSEGIRQIEDYVDDRIGFREQAIAAYIRLNDKLFHVMVHPLFMYGREGHIYYKDKDYIAAYQRLNTDPEYLDSFVDFLDKTDDFLKGKDIRFLYFLCPDKKTVYPEYFPDSINVNEANERVIDHMMASLDKTDIEYIIPEAELLKAKEHEVVYNQKYDVTHWNELGSFLGHSLIDQRIRDWFPDVKPLLADDFTLDYVTMTNLDVADFPIHDDVPVYTLKSDTSEDSTEYLKGSMNFDTGTFYAHYINPAVENNRILLVFTDSYFATYHKYYNNRFKEVYFIHRQNYEYLQYYVDLLFPDMVIFETAERSITSEMPLMADFSDVYYEKAYQGSGRDQDLKTNNELSYTITWTGGVRIEGNRIYIDPNEGDSVVSVDGILNAYDPLKSYDIYYLIDGNHIETDYMKLHKDYEELKGRVFSINIQRRYLAPCEIKLIVVDEETKEEYLLEDFEVEYGR